MERSRDRSFEKMAEERNVKPFVKWVGGKRQLLPELLPRLPDAIDCYWEPFLGGGALFFAIQPERAQLSDLNIRLINAYQCIQHHPDLIISYLKRFKNEEDFYYSIRESFNEYSPVRSDVHPAEQAARFLYLNKTCFNGLYRENQSGKFNVPFGKRKSVNFVDEENLMACHKLLSSPGVKVGPGDFGYVSDYATGNDFVYLDPPYVPLNVTSSFTQYTKDDFGPEEHNRLLNMCIELDNNGVKWMQSNSTAPIVLEMYKNFNIEFVEAKRNISASIDGRTPVQEVIIRNY